MNKYLGYIYKIRRKTLSNDTLILEISQFLAAKKRYNIQKFTEELKHLRCLRIVI
jgi:hypothetical protein